MQRIYESLRQQVATGILSLGLITASAGQAIAAEPLDCSLQENWKEFHVSTQPSRDDLRPLQSSVRREGQAIFRVYWRNSPSLAKVRSCRSPLTEF